MNIIKHKNIFFAISLIVIIPGIISLFLFGLNKSIDFTGGSRLEYQFSSKDSVTQTDISSVFQKEKVEVGSIENLGNNTFSVRTKPIDQKTYEKIKADFSSKYSDVKELDFTTVGPVIGSETTANAFKSLLIASLLIVLYIAWSFRSVPKPANSFRFGICAILALIHDVLVVVGIFSILGHFFKVEVDSLFVTALLTVIGFSVHDTIVVFDRIRENLKRMSGPFETVVNESILQTLGRSLNTSLTVLLVLLAMLLFGGESVRWFVVALLVGITSGTYSSIFNASPLLVLWHEMRSPKKNESRH